MLATLPSPNITWKEGVLWSSALVMILSPARCKENDLLINLAGGSSVLFLLFLRCFPAPTSKISWPSDGQDDSSTPLPIPYITAN
jgi:hypothetical protein